MDSMSFEGQSFLKSQEAEQFLGVSLRTLGTITETGLIPRKRGGVVFDTRWMTWCGTSMDSDRKV